MLNYVSSRVRSKSVCFPEGDPSCICGNSSRGRLGRRKQLNYDRKISIVKAGNMESHFKPSLFIIQSLDVGDVDFLLILLDKVIPSVDSGY